VIKLFFQDWKEGGVALKILISLLPYFPSGNDEYFHEELMLTHPFCLFNSIEHSKEIPAFSTERALENAMVDAFLYI
jgi:hypothetical protein